MRTTTQSLKYLVTLFICICICLFSITTAANTYPNDKATTTEDPSGNVSIFMVTVGSFPDYGVNIPFNIVVTNEGANEVYDIEVTNTIPADYTFNASSTDSVATSVSNIYTNTIAGPIVRRVRANYY